jgi:hypothetical protein
VFSAGVIVLLGALALVGAVCWWVWWRKRATPEERERQRRQLVHQEGRIIEALVTGVDGDTVFYQYSLRGVDYNTAQDCSWLAGRLPASRDSLVGPAACKYHRSNPANSIILCEEWSGFASGFNKIERTNSPS